MLVAAANPELNQFVRNADIVGELQQDAINVSYMWRWLDGECTLWLLGALPDCNTLLASREILSAGGSSRINGLEFKYQGVLGIWEGFGPLTSSSTLASTQAHSNAIDSPNFSPLLGMGTPQAHSSPAIGYNSNLGLSRPPSQRGGKRGERHRSPQRDGYDAAISILNMRRDSMADNTGDNGAAFSSSDSREKRRFGRLGRRRLALALCGWDINNTEIRTDISRSGSGYRFKVVNQLTP